MFGSSQIVKSVLVLIVAINICYAQIVNAPFTYVGSDNHQPRSLVQGPPIAISHPSELSHPSVVANSIAESQLPPELLKSHRFLSNPHVAEGLAQASWLTDKEAPVFEREAEKIPREQVFKLFKNAGYIQRRKRFVQFY